MSDPIRLKQETARRRASKHIVWLWITGAYFACLSPIWLDGLTLGTVGGVLCLGILVTYVLSRIYHDLLLVADWIVRLIERLSL
jgi:hypothetical protein